MPIVDIGAAPNDDTGDPLRVAFDKINIEFSNSAGLVAANAATILALQAQQGANTLAIANNAANIVTLFANDAAFALQIAALNLVTAALPVFPEPTAINNIVVTNASATFQNHLTFTFITPVFPAEYLLFYSFLYNYNDTSTNFEAQVVEGAAVLWFGEKEPKDSAGNDPVGTNSDQKIQISGVIPITSISTAARTFNIRYRGESGGTSASMWGSRMTIMRES